MGDALKKVAERLKELSVAIEELCSELSPPEVKQEEVRRVLAEMSKCGKTAEVKALLEKYGASKLSEVKPENYADLLTAAKEAVNA